MADHYRILVSDQLHPAGWEALHSARDVEMLGPTTGREATLAAVREADALIIRSTTQVDAELLVSALRLRVVARAGARLDNIDLDLASRLGILVINVPSASLAAVAEHTFALLLALARGLPDGYNAVRAGKWPRHSMLGFQLLGKTIGIIGYGRLGRQVAQIASAFGMRVLAYDPYIDLSFAYQQGVEIVSFFELMERSDIISLHTRLSAVTRGMLNREAFGHVRPGAYLVNCTDAGLVDEAALLDALDRGILAGAALDTFSEEPPAQDHPLVCHTKVLPTPHLNQNTEESQSETSRQVVADVLDALRGLDYRNVVNLPFSPELPYAAVRPYIELASKLGKLQGQLAEGWIIRVEVECLGENMENLVRPVAAVLLSGMLLPVDGRQVNWISAPPLAHEQGIVTTQVLNLVQLEDYPNLIACRIQWQGGGSRTVAGALFGNGEARLVYYEGFHVDAYPHGYVLVLENEDRPGVIGKVGMRLGQAGINIAQWRYGREPIRQVQGGRRAVSFINLDSRVPRGLLAELEQEPEIFRARLVKL